jgi:hypothetical protein
VPECNLCRKRRDSRHPNPCDSRGERGQLAGVAAFPGTEAGAGTFPHRSEIEGADVAIHYFHCTDGKSLIVDRAGRRTRSESDVVPLAFAVAGELMRSNPDPLDWSEWLVSVQDQSGSMVTVVPFPARGGGSD